MQKKVLWWTVLKGMSILQDHMLDYEIMNLESGFDLNSDSKWNHKIKKRVMWSNA